MSIPPHVVLWISPQPTSGEASSIEKLDGEINQMDAWVVHDMAYGENEEGDNLIAVRLGSQADKAAVVAKIAEHRYGVHSRVRIYQLAILNEPCR